VAGFLPKKKEQFHKIPNAKVAIVAAMWHPQFVDAMVDRAIAEMQDAGVSRDNISVHTLPGSLELPLAANMLFESDPELSAVMAFGVVLQGATTHDASVLQTVVEGFGQVSLKHNKPIINEVIGVTSLDDAAARSDDSESNKGLEAVFALTELLHWQDTLTQE
jgi:6,7-dimethyl-8-ribityllumazine synthase